MLNYVPSDFPRTGVVFVCLPLNIVQKKEARMYKCCNKRNFTFIHAVSFTLLIFPAVFIAVSILAVFPGPPIRCDCARAVQSD